MNLRNLAIEVLWEVRFELADQSFSEVIPGMIYSAISQDYPYAEVVNQDGISPNDLRYKYGPRVIFRSPENRFVQIGRQMISFSIAGECPDWLTVYEHIRNLVSIIRNFEFITRIEQFSLKYTYLITCVDNPDINNLNVSIKLGDDTISTSPIKLAAEITENDLSYTIRLLSPAEVYVPGNESVIIGIVLDIECVRQMQNNESWNDMLIYLNRINTLTESKAMTLISEEKIRRIEFDRLLIGDKIILQ